MTKREAKMEKKLLQMKNWRGGRMPCWRTDNLSRQMRNKLRREEALRQGAKAPF